MSSNPAPNPQPGVDPLEAAVDHAIELCGGDMRATIGALIITNELLESQNREMAAAASRGYARLSLPPDCKDRYD
jgi:hypothetical protein